jgi:hypothetical protein
MTDETDNQSRDPFEGGRLFVAAVEAALADLARRRPEGIGPIERAEASRIRLAAARLRECIEQLAEDELLVRGSTGQRRQHPLLKVEEGLRREISNGLNKLEFRIEQKAMFARLTAAHFARQRKPGAEEPS